MLTNTKTDTTLFKHIVEKVESEKSELLKSVNREITRKRDSWCKNPSVYVLYRIQSDRLYTEYWNANIIQELHFSPKTDILVGQIPADNHQALSAEQFNEFINRQLSAINRVLLNSDSMKISDDMSLDDYFKDLKRNSKNDNLELRWLRIGNFVTNYRLSIFDINGKIAAIALIFWLDVHFFEFEKKQLDIEPLLEQIKLIILKSANHWSMKFVENIKSIFDLETDELANVSKIAIKQICEINALFNDILSLKTAESAIETASQS